MDRSGHSLHAVLVEIGCHYQQLTEFLLLAGTQAKSLLIGQKAEYSFFAGLPAVAHVVSSFAVPT